MQSAATFQLCANRRLTFPFSGVASVRSRRFRTKPSSVVRCIDRVSSTNHTAFVDVEPIVIRRSADYKDCVWDHDFIQHSMHTKYNDLEFRKKADEMSKEIGEMLLRVSEHSVTEQLELIDDIQRLGLAYHFKNQIKSILDRIHYETIKSCEGRVDLDLHTAALAFRLLRTHGHFVPEGIFACFLDYDQEFDTSITKNIKGMISLYEASFLAMEGETIMDKARTFAITHLKKSNDDTITYLGELKARALEMPLHWRTERAEARWHIEQSYVKNPKVSSCLLRFAKLDYNIVQAMYQEELQDLSRWWKSLGFKEGLGFARDCLVASYLWSIYICPEPKDIECRKVLTKTIALVCTLDDICDIYATLDEIELLNDAFARWDIDSMNKLPPYMKKCYLACYNTVNQMSYEVLNRNGFDVTPIFKSSWGKLLKVFMKEARWFNNGHKPTLNEYLNVAWISIGASLVALHAQAFDINSIGPNFENELKYLEIHPDISKWSAMIVRLTDDLGTSSAEMERGDNPKSIECLMRETRETEEGAREKVKEMVIEIWKKMNKCGMNEMTLEFEGVRRLMNLARGGHCCYQHGDGQGIQDKETKHLMSQIIFDPIP